MEYIIGIVLALLVSLFARLVAFDRDRAFYPTVLMVIAAYYVLFAAMGASIDTLLVESIVMIGFTLFAVVGFKTSLWLVAGALALHGVFDFIHGRLITNPGVPAWWPMFCMTYDVTASACLAWLLSRSQGDVSRHPHS